MWIYSSSINSSIPNYPDLVNIVDWLGDNAKQIQASLLSNEMVKLVFKPGRDVMVAAKSVGMV
jgi:hypothetical protein